MKKSNKALQVTVSSLILLSTSASSVFAGYGSTPSVAAPCNNQAPTKPVFSFVRKIDSDEIEIGWNKVDLATKWTVAYGLESGKYIYGAADFGDNNSRSIKISMLPPNVYYLVVKASNGCMPGPFSSERKMTVTPEGKVLGVKTWPQYILGDRIEAEPSVSPSPSPLPSPSISPSPAASPVQFINQNTDTPKKIGIFQKIWVFFFGE